ncbi:MAG: hypothetical protein P4L84_14535 [Isosphaeraceae bacterium]|nr:hypothetical protein [Isosphaeraceae bacterium]
MVTAAAVLWLGLVGAAPATSTAPEREALAKGNYPWYDRASDSAKPIIPKGDWNWEWVPDWKFGKLPGLGSLGDLIALVMIVVALAVFAGTLFWLWRRYEPGLADTEVEARRRAGALRIEGLPEGLRPETDDPWNEALRRRQRGDFAGAVVCLFAHQLLTLDRLRKVRLVPGRTGRQLVRTIDDAHFHACVEPTLRLFEAVYYGHRAPSREAFEAVWAFAEQFEQRAAAGAGA